MGRHHQHESDSSSSHHKKHHNKSHKCEYDYIVVGDGAAGCIVARKLSDEIKVHGKCKRPSVLVLERGANQIQQFGYPTNEIMLVPNVLVADGGFVGGPNNPVNQLTNDPKYSHLLTSSINSTTSDPILSSRPPFDSSTGNGWGGGSSHYYMLAFRGSPHVWNDYASINGDSSWNYNSLLPTFKALETYTPNTGGCFDATQRGSHGPISIIQSYPDDLVNPSSPNCDPTLKAYATNPTVGVGYSCDINSGSQPAIGIGSAQWYNTTPVINGYGKYRSWSHNSFLPIGTIINTDGQGLNGRNLTIRSNSLVNRVLFKGNKAIGVEYVDTITNQYKKVYGKKIILSAGALGTPVILQRSGVGDATLLSSLGIPTVFNNPNVGSGLENHLGTAAFFDSPPPQILGEYMTDLHNSSLSPSDPFYYPADGIRRVFAVVGDGVLLGLPGKTFSTSRVEKQNNNGTVKIVSTDPLVDPNINYNMFSDDTTGLVNGSTLNKLMAWNYNIKKVSDDNSMSMFVPPPPVFASTTALADFIKASASFQQHPVGTCRFGTSAANGVVDSKQNVFGVKNLKIADLSIYPYTPDGNPMFAALTAAMKCVESLGVSTDPAL